jgi:hypothetical protein
MSVAGSVYNDLTDEQLRALYAWIDAIPLSRPKRNITRDFSDGVLLAEVVAAYFPQLVELHNYTAANSVKQKIYNFETLNQRVLKRLGYLLTRGTIEDIVNCKQGVVEIVLNNLQLKMAKFKEKKQRMDNDSLSKSPIPKQQPKVVETRNQKPQIINKDENSNISVQRAQPLKQSSPPKQRQQQQQQQQQQPLHAFNKMRSPEDEALLREKDEQIYDLVETVKILELKISKLEQLVRIKDTRIAKLSRN